MKITKPESDASNGGSTDVDYRSLLWQVLDAGLVLEKVHKELKAVQEHVTGDTEIARLGIIQERLTEVRTVFGQVRGRAQAVSYCAQLHTRSATFVRSRAGQ